MGEDKSGNKHLSPLQALITIIVFLTVLGVGYITWKVIRDNRQSSAMNKYNQISKQADIYIPEYDTTKSEIDSMIKTLDLLPKDIYVPEKKTQVLVLKGNLLLKVKRNEKALEAFNEAKTYRSTDKFVNLGLARAYFALGNYAESVKSINNAMAFLTKDDREIRVFCYYMQGESMENLKDWGRAQWAYNEARSVIKQFAIEPVFTNSDISDWSGFMDTLRTSQNPWVNRVVKLLNRDAISIIDKYKSGDKLTPENRETIINALNSVLSSDRLYSSQVYENLTPYKSPMRASADDIKTFSNNDTKLINRMILDNTFADYIVASPVAKSYWRYFLLSRE